MNEIATRGRHFGHKAFFICQRAKMVSTTIRTQCSDLVVFKQAYADVKDLANEFVEPIILDADKLEDGEFIYIRKGYKPIKSNVFGM